MAFIHGKAGAVYIDGVDLSAYCQKVSKKANVDTPETTTLQAAAKTYITGVPDAQLSIDAIFDAAVGAITPKLDSMFGAAVNPIVQVCPAGGAVVGERCYFMQAIEMDYSEIVDIGDANKVNFNLQSVTGFESAVISHPKGAETATGNDTNAAQDNGAGTPTSTNGLSAALEVFALAGTGGPSLTAVIQHSTDNSTYVDLVSFAAQTTAPGSQRVAVAVGTTINRYLRSRRTISGTTPSFTYAVAIDRK